MCADYKTKSRNTDFEQHANKIFTAIREINPVYAEKRAIWELFQNALDIVEDKGIIRISETDRGLKFEHNGRPFNDGNLTGLIKQSSNGKTYGSNEDGVGQYGTGFLSTHVYGTKIWLNASVDTDRGEIKCLNDFIIDRDAHSPDELNEKIQQQDKVAEQLCDGEENNLTKHLEFTSFEYLADQESKPNIRNMFEYIHEVLPFIFVFNDKLERVDITTAAGQITYLRGESKDSPLCVFRNEIPQQVHYLQNTIGTLKVVLPQSNLDFQAVPKQFLFYPLAETVELGINFIIHAQDFKPNKERDYLFLEPLTQELKNDVETNQKMLDEAFELVQKKAMDDPTIDFLAIADVLFYEEETVYWKEKKNAFIHSIKELERIPVGKNKAALNAIPYLHQDILDLDEEKVKSLYEVVNQFYSIPEYKVYIYLSIRVNNWNDSSFKLLHFKDIFHRIKEATHGSYSNIEHKKSYQNVIKIIASDSKLLREQAVIPNIHNQLCVLLELKKWETKESALIQVMDQVNATVSQCYLHEDFYFLENVPAYTREDFKDDLNKFNGEQINLLEKNDKQAIQIDSVVFNRTIQTLVYFIGLNKTTETNKKYADFFARQYALSPPQDSIESPTVIVNYDSSFKLLARLYIEDLSAKGTEAIESRIEDLKEFVLMLYHSPELKKNLLDKLQCFPSQLFQLKSQNDLKIDEIKDEDFKDTYKTITGNEVRRHLLLPGFEKYIAHTNAESGLNLGDQIEKKLDPDKKFLPINPTILYDLIELIKHISKPDSKWASWLTNIDKVKEEILLSKFKDEETRLSLLNILSGTPERIQTLGKLAETEDLDALIKAGKEKQKEERRKKTHIKYITKIGLQIQDLIKTQLDESLAEIIEIVQSDSDENLKTVEEQDGQDFIIYKSGHPIYFIEVKSRWDIDGIVALSKRQVERCAQNPKCYAVITVNVADYKARNKPVDENISFDELSQDVYVNMDMGQNFEQLIQTNQQYEGIPTNAKLIEFRGHIPQDRIRNTGIDFNQFIARLKPLLLAKK